jgi:hypothetical protein
MMTAAMPLKPMPLKSMTAKSMAAKSMAAKSVAAVKMMSAEAEENARPVTIIARIITIIIIGRRGSNIATRPIASPVIVADEAHSLQISI